MSSSYKPLALKATAMAAVIALSSCGGDGDSTPMVQANDCSSGRELSLVNGKIYTMGGAKAQATSVTIRDAKFVAIDDTASSLAAECRQTIDLKRQGGDAGFD